MSDKKQEKLSKAQGKKLGFLLAASTLPERMKQEIIALLDKMSLEQIDRLINIFEAKYLDDATRVIDEKYKKKIENIVKEYEREQKNIIDNLLKQVDAIN